MYRIGIVIFFAQSFIEELEGLFVNYSLNGMVFYSRKFGLFFVFLIYELL